MTFLKKKNKLHLIHHKGDNEQVKTKMGSLI